MIIGRLERMYLDGEITEEEYKEKKVEYLDLLFEMYEKDLITKEEYLERLNK